MSQGEVQEQIDAAPDQQEPVIAEFARIAIRTGSDLPWLILPTGIACQVEPEQQPALVPNVKAWFSGVVNRRGQMVPVFDFHHWATGTPLTGQTTLVIIGQGADNYAVTCTESPRVILCQHSAQSVDPTIAEPLKSCLGATYSSRQGLAYEFDPDRWLKQIAADVPLSA